MKSITVSTLVFLFSVFLSSQRCLAQQINPKIQEVYGDKTQEILQNDPERLQILNDLLENRIKILKSPIVSEDKYAKLSSVPLQNKYNTNLKRDLVFDPDNFNPLKYGMNFFTSEVQIYRVDNTDYLIVIEQQKTK
jgi:hypothetical protein